jgi:hypothetical protein
MLKKNISILIIGLKYQYSLENFYKKAFYSIGIKKISYFSNNIYFYLYCLLCRLKLKFFYRPINGCVRGGHSFGRSKKFQSICFVWQGSDDGLGGFLCAQIPYDG